MATHDYSEWRLDDDDDEAEVDYSAWETSTKDAILFCIQCSESMHEIDPDKGEDGKSSFHAALDCALQLQKRKVIAGPNDSVGIVFWDTVERKGDHRNMYVYQDVGLITAASIQAQMQTLDRAERNPSYLSKQFPASAEPLPIADVLMACNVILRNGAAKTGTKRVFLITDNDDPTSGMKRDAAAKMRLTARTRAGDIYDRGWDVVPFFISSPSKPFDVRKFWADALARPESDEEMAISTDLATSFEDLLKEMQIRENPRRTLFKVPLHLAENLSIGVKGYGLVTEQRKGQYKYLTDIDGVLKEASTKTTYADKDDHLEVPKADIRYALNFGKTWEDDKKKPDDEDVDMDEKEDKGRGRKGNIFEADVPELTRQNVLFDPEKMKELRSMNLEPGIKILGFKDRSELGFFDNVKHSTFIYCDEDSYTGSTRTFAALLHSVAKKEKIGVALSVTRKGYTPQFVALLPQEEEVEEETGAQLAPPGFHMIPFPFADDIRESAYEQLLRCTEHEKQAARSWIDKMTLKTGYVPDSFPNPMLNLHYRHLQAAAFNEAFETEEFEDLTVPNYASIQKRAGHLIEEFKDVVDADGRSQGVVSVKTGAKRQADTTADEVEVRSRYHSGTLGKLTVVQLRGFLHSRDIKPSGKKKQELVDQVEEYLQKHE